jgi:hypothetical protein
MLCDFKISYITIANDDRLTSPRCCQGLHITVGGEPFNIDCCCLVLGSYDMVFGV